MGTVTAAPHRWPIVRYCQRCEALEAMHEIRADGSRGKRYGMSGGQAGKSASVVACSGFEPGRVKERLSEPEMDRRLEAVLALHAPDAEELSAHPDPVFRDGCSCGWRGLRLRRADEPAQACPTVCAARGET